MGNSRKHITEFLTRFLNDESGQSTTEYILILAVVVMVAMKFKSTFGSKLDSIVQKLGGQLDSATSDISSTSP